MIRRMFVSKLEVTVPFLLVFTPSLCSFVSLATTTCVISSSSCSNWLRGGSCSPSPLVPSFGQSECHKDFHCCVKLAPAVYNYRRGLGCVCAKESFGYPETVFDLPWLVLQLEKGCCRKPKWQLRYWEHCVVQVLLIHHSKQQILFLHPDKSSSRH